jgi:hypothetical protein
MSSERPTVRPVTLARLVELTHACEGNPRTTSDLEARLEVSHRRARETVLEAERIGFVDIAHQESNGAEDSYVTTRIGEQFLASVREETWEDASTVLETWSPHYSALLSAVEVVEPAPIEAVLDELEAAAEFTPYTYNQTSVEVLGDWAERLGRIQRNAFAGTYYCVSCRTIPTNFARVLLTVYDDLEETAGVSLRQRYLSIPRLREYVCERVGCTRAALDDGFVALAAQNVGKLELSGAPIDTGAKDAALGIKTMSRSDSDGLVSTAQSTEQVMAGVEQFGKQYYYLAVHDRDLTYNPPTSDDTNTNTNV